MGQGAEIHTPNGRLRVIGREGKQDGKYYYRYKSFFKTYDINKRLSDNRPYLACYIALRTAACIWGTTEKELKKILKKHRVYPVYYYKRTPEYLVADIAKVAKKEGVIFVIPVGLYNTGEYVYVGHEFSVIEACWHPYRIRRFTSLLEMYTRMGIPVQNTFIAPSVIPKLEDDFIYAICKLLTLYNKANPENKKRLMLCTKFGHREEAQKIIDTYSKKFPNIIYTIDFDHLVRLRKLADRKHKKC